MVTQIQEQFWNFIISHHDKKKGEYTIVRYFESERPHSYKFIVIIVLLYN